METYFDPRDTRCKTPFGAAKCGTEVRFALSDDAFCGCELLVYREFAAAEDVCPLPPAEGGFAGTYTVSCQRAAPSLSGRRPFLPR